MVGQFRSKFYGLFYTYSPRRLLTNWEEEYQIPITDVIVPGDRFEMTLELTGILKEDMCAEITSNSNELSVEKKEKQEGNNWLRKERKGSYDRYFNFLYEIDSDNVDAEMKDGVINIDLSKQQPPSAYDSKEVNIK